jgi:predicted esterase
MADQHMQSDLSFKAEINLFYDVYVPQPVIRPAPLLIAVHGYGAHKRYMMREARLVAPDGWVIASVQGPHQHFRPVGDGYRIGFGWLTDHKPDEFVRMHHRFLLDVIGKLGSDGVIDPNRVYLYGFSQACALNFRFAFTHPNGLQGVIGVCGGIPGDLETNENYILLEASTMYLYGNDDEFYSREQFREYDRKLAARLSDYRSKRFDAKHEITEEMRAEIREFLSLRK